MLIIAAVSALSNQRSASAFVFASRWTTNAAGAAGMRGDPITLTWSLVPDASPIPDRQASTLVAFLDGAFGTGEEGDDLALRPWFPLVDSAFARWSALGGVQFIYEPNDDGAPQYAASGVLGIRGDVRLAATSGDGPGRTLASSQYPDAGDVVFDADDVLLLANPDRNRLRLRNALMHEIGHVLGLAHVVSSDAEFLMEAALDLDFDGPQLDEIRGLHYLYGDVHERAHGGAGNDSPPLAVNLGLMAPGAVRTLGGDAAGDLSVAATETDFLSISNRSDLDYFRVEIAAPSWLDVDLTPHGGSFRQGEFGSPEFLIDATASGDLSFSILAGNEVPLVQVNNHSRGQAESLRSFYLPEAGEYFIRVSSAREAVQLYELKVGIHAAHAPEPSSSMLMSAMTGVLLTFHRGSICKRQSSNALNRSGANHEACDA